MKNGRRRKWVTYEPSTADEAAFATKHIFTLSFVHICPRVRDNSDELKRAIRHCRHRSHHIILLAPLSDYEPWAVKRCGATSPRELPTTHTHTRHTYTRRDAMQCSTTCRGPYEYNRINGGFGVFGVACCGISYRARVERSRWPEKTRSQFARRGRKIWQIMLYVRSQIFDFFFCCCYSGQKRIIINFHLKDCPPTVFSSHPICKMLLVGRWHGS